MATRYYGYRPGMNGRAIYRVYIFACTLCSKFIVNCAAQQTQHGYFTTTDHLSWIYARCQKYPRRSKQFIFYKNEKVLEREVKSFSIL